jgi:hypothetical protein
MPDAIDQQVGAYEQDYEKSGQKPARPDKSLVPGIGLQEQYGKVIKGSGHERNAGVYCPRPPQGDLLIDGALEKERRNEPYVDCTPEDE